MKKYCVYIHKNKINGKIYVGQTCKSPNTRFGLKGQQYCYNEETKFAKAITQYDMNMIPIKTYESGTEIKRLFNYDNSFIARACKTHKSAYGYYWRYTSPTTTE